MQTQMEFAFNDDNKRKEEEPEQLILPLQDVYGLNLNFFVKAEGRGTATENNENMELEIP